MKKEKGKGNEEKRSYFRTSQHVRDLRSNLSFPFTDFDRQLTSVPNFTHCVKCTHYLYLIPEPDLILKVFSKMPGTHK